MADDNPFSAIPVDSAEANPFASIPSPRVPADANLPHPYNLGDAMHTLAQTFMPNPQATQAAFWNPGATLQAEAPLAERYPQGIMQSAQDIQNGQSPNVLSNFFSPNQNPKDATAIAQDIGDKAIPPAVIANPDSHLDYLKAFTTNFIKDLPFTTAGVGAELANPNNAFLTGALAHVPNVSIAAPAWVDNAIQKMIDFAGFRPLTALNNTLKENLTNHLADTIHDKVQNAPGWLDQFKRTYGEDTTSDDVRDMIKNKVDQAVQNTHPNAIQLAKAIIKTKGSNLPGIMVPSKELPPGSPIMADQYAATPDKPLNEGPVTDFAPATVDTVKGDAATSEPVQPLEGQSRTEHLARVQMALDLVQKHEDQKAKELTDKGIPTAPTQVPPAQNLDKVLQEKLVQTAKNELAKPEGNDLSVQKALLKVMHRDEEGVLEDNVERPISAITMNQNKEDAGSTPVFDWRNLRHSTIDELAQQIKNENVLRVEKGLPAIDPSMDLMVSKHNYAGQEKGIEDKVRKAVILAYKRSPVEQTPDAGQVQEVNPFLSQTPSSTTSDTKTVFLPYPVHDNNPFPDVMKVANEAGKQAQENLSTPNGGSLAPEPLANGPETTHIATNAVGQTVGMQKQPDIEAKLPKAEHILHDIEQVEAHNARIVVKELRDVEALLNIVRTLGKQLAGKSYEEAQQIIADAAGISVPKVKALLKASIKADVKNTESVLQNSGVAHRQDVEEQLREAMQLLQDWDESRSQRNLPQPKDLVAPTTKDLREKGIDGDRSKETKFWNTPEERLNKPTIDHLGLTREGTTNEQVDAARILFDKQARASTNKMKQQVIAHHGVYDKLYIDEINALIEKLPENSSARKIIENAMLAIKKLTSNGTKELNGHTVYKTLVDNGHIKFAMNQVRDAVREAEQATARAKQKLEEASGYENLSKEEVDAAASEHPDDREAKEPTDPSEHDSDIVFDNRIDIEEKPFDEDGEDLMYTADPMKMLKDAFNPQVKIMRYGQEPRECAAPGLLAFLRQNPFIAKLDDWFTFKMGGDIAMQKKAIDTKYRFSSGEAMDAVQHFAMYEQAVEGIVRSELQPLYNDLEKQVKQFMKNHPLGIKADAQGLKQVVDKYSSLLAEASEQVMVRSYDAHSYAYSELGHGPHKDAFEKDAYVKAMKEWYDFFKKPYTQADIIRWETQRTPDIWNLLNDPMVMNNDKLQRIVLFYKAQIEMPYLQEQIKNGIFSNADIWKSIVEGYHMKNFARKGEQSDLAGNIKNFFLPKSPLGNVNMPTADTSSQQAFKSKARTDSWVAINDFFSDNAEYMKRALLSIKQAQLLKEISKLPLPKLEFFSPNFVKALEEHPVPAEWQFKKVQAATDKVIIDTAKHMTDVMFTPAEIAKGLEIEKQTGKNPYSITPMTVLAEGGWIQSHQDDGLNKWYRGSFSPPFVYKTLYEMIQTVFRTATGFDRLPGYAQLYMTGKQMLLIDPLVHVPQYIGNVILDSPMHTVPGAMVTLPIKSSVAFFKGIVKTGPEILAGKYTQDVGKTQEERQWARAFIERGATMVGGYNTFLHNMIGKADKGMFPQRQEFGDKLRDYLLSGFGTGPSVLGEMIGQHALKVMIAMTKEYIAQGIDPEKAMRMTVYRCNTAMNNLNQVSWQGSRLGAFLSITTYSKNFAVGATRMMMMATQTPIGGAIMGGLLGGAAGGYVGAAVGGTIGARIAATNKFKFKSGSGAGGNVFTGSDIPADFRDQLNSDMLKGVSMAMFWTAVFYGIAQYALWNAQSDDYKKEHPDEGFWWNNPVPHTGSLNLFMSNVNNQPLYLTYNGFRLGKDIADQLAPLVNQAGKTMTGNKDFNLGGKGPVKYTADKFGAAFSYIESMVNHKFLTDGSQIWNTDEKTQWKQAAQAVSYIAGKNVPINPWIGGSMMKTPMTEDKFINMLMESATLYGAQYHVGAPTSGSISEKQSEQWKSDVRYENYVDKNGTNPFANFNGGRNLDSPEAMRAARSAGEISQRQFVNFFKKQNPSNYFKQNRRKIITAENENSTTENPLQQMQSVENPENL